MATITKSADAPADAFHFSIGQESFFLNDATPSFTTDDSDVIHDAGDHPYLTVGPDEEPAPVVAPAAPVAAPISIGGKN